MEEKNSNQNVSMSNIKEKCDSKKYIFYKKPSIKKKAPEVKQTLTSYKRMLKANPLLKCELEGKDLSILNMPPPNCKNYVQNNSESAGRKCTREEKQSLQPNFNGGKPLISKLKISQSLKNPPKLLQSKKDPSSIISGNKPVIHNTGRSIMSKQFNTKVNAPKSKFTCSTPLESKSKLQNINKEKNFKGKSSYNAANGCFKNNDSSTNKNTLLTQKGKPQDKPLDKSKTSGNIRRSLSAQHFERKKGGTTKVNQVINSSSRANLTKSLEDFSKLKPCSMHHDISPVVEDSRETSTGTSIIFKTPSAYERRSIAKFTPQSAFNSRRSLYHPLTPLPSLNDLQKRLNNWLVKRGKVPSGFQHLKCFGIQEEMQNVDEENKENIEVDQDLDKGSFEDLKIDNTNSNNKVDSNSKDNEIKLNEENTEVIAKAALDDLHKLIRDGYPVPQCEGWLELIRQKYTKLEEEPHYWECRAAIEQSRGNISVAVQCYRTAIVQGAEIQSVDESLDILLKKFSLLNISATDAGNEKSVRERARIVADARNVFKSSIIQFAVQEKKLKKNDKVIENEKKLVATPVRRTTRLSRSMYASTPGVKICSSLQELDTSDREMMDFKTNKALF